MRSFFPGALVSICAVPFVNGFDIQMMIRKRMKAMIVDAATTGPSLDTEYQPGADTKDSAYAYHCFSHMYNGETDDMWGSPERTFETWWDVVFEQGGVCKILQDLADSSQVKEDAVRRGCAYMVEAIVSFADKGLLCTKAAECVGNSSVPTIFDGLCTAGCELDMDKRLECRTPLLVSVGLTHDRVCGDKVPTYYSFNMLSFLELFTMCLFILFKSMVEIGVTKCMGTKHGPKDMVIDGIHMAFQTAIVTYTAVQVMFLLKEVPSTCDFVVLGLAPLFAPYLYSMSQVVASSALVVDEVMESAEKQKSEEAPQGEFNIKDVGCIGWIFLLWVPGMIFTFVQACILFVMFLIAFWGLAAYIHIAVVIGVGLGVLNLCVYGCIQVLLEGDTGEEAIKKLVQEKKVGTAFKIFGASFFFGLGSLTLFFTSTFLLYIHGEWMLFHNAFFSEFRFGFPTFAIDFSALEHLLATFLALFNRNFTLPKNVFQLSAFGSFVPPLLKWSMQLAGFLYSRLPDTWKPWKPRNEDES